ncbi:MAG: PH domain-containing protein [Caldilineales bacterium]|nr:PH domain-containing protein [Caldilineales bacterium]
MYASRGQVRTRHHVTSVVGPVLVFGGMFILSLCTFLVFYAIDRDANLSIQVACQIAAMIFGGLVIWEYIQWRCYQVFVGNPRVVERRGWLFHRERVWDLTSAAIVLKQNPVDRMLDKGDVVIFPGNGSSIQLDNLASFAQIRDRLQSDR